MVEQRNADSSLSAAQQNLGEVRPVSKGLADDGLKIPHTKIVQGGDTHVPKSHLVSEFALFIYLYTAEKMTDLHRFSVTPHPTAPTRQSLLSLPSRLYRLSSRLSYGQSTGDEMAKATALLRSKRKGLPALVLHFIGHCSNSSQLVCA